MITFHEFITDFTWKDLLLTLLTVGVIIMAREEKRIFRRKKNG